MNEGLEQVIHTRGFATCDEVIEPELADQLTEEIAAYAKSKSAPLHALRHLHRLIPSINSAVDHPSIRQCVSRILGPEALPVRSLFFDKTPQANWKVAWHQDLTIAVEERHDYPGFGPWSIKNGVWHVQPPADVLAQMLTVRIHLDSCDANNGPLQVLPGSHREGRLSPEAISAWRTRVEPVSCLVPKGGVVLMKPLLLHASSPALRPSHRRVLHIEFATATLPDGLRWLC